MRNFRISSFAFLCLAACLCLTRPATAQSNDSLFANYADYAAYVDNQIMTRRFSELVQRLGGRDEYIIEGLMANQRQLENVWPYDFEDMLIFRQEDLGNGLRQEGRMYWTGKSYAFFYALLHQRDADLVVITFLLNSSSKAVLGRF